MASEAAEVYEIPCGAISLLQALTKRQEHQQASWVCFLDLVRAFVRHRQSPTAFRRRIKNGCASAFTKSIVPPAHRRQGAWGDEVIDSSTGARQGSSEVPCLFLLILQACLESMNWPPGITKPEFHTTDAANGKIHGERCTRKSTKFEHWLQLFADDAAIIFESKLTW